MARSSTRKSPAELDRDIAHALTRTSALSKLSAIADKHEDFLYGRCATFAIAMHRLTTLPIYGLVGFDEDVEKNVLIHAYVRRDEDTRIDIKGPRSLDEIYTDFLDDPATLDADEVPLTSKRSQSWPLDPRSVRR